MTKQNVLCFINYAVCDKKMHEFDFDMLKWEILYLIPLTVYLLTNC